MISVLMDLPSDFFLELLEAILTGCYRSLKRALLLQQVLNSRNCVTVFWGLIKKRLQQLEPALSSSGVFGQSKSLLGLFQDNL